MPTEQDLGPPINNPFMADDSIDETIGIINAEEDLTEEDFKKLGPRKSRIILSNGKLGAMVGLEHQKWRPKGTIFILKFRFIQLFSRLSKCCKTCKIKR